MPLVRKVKVAANQRRAHFVRKRLRYSQYSRYCYDRSECGRGWFASRLPTGVGGRIAGNPYSAPDPRCPASRSGGDDRRQPP